MIKRRTLLSILPFGLIAACAKAQSAEAEGTRAFPTSMNTTPNLASLIGRVNTPVWLRLTGSVRLSVDNANAREATLHRAILMHAGQNAPRYFDVWQVQGAAIVAAPSVTNGTDIFSEEPTDAGGVGTWLWRRFSYTGPARGVEYSRLSLQKARIMMIDSTQIWLAEGGVVAQGPVLDPVSLAAFEAWEKA